MNERFTAHAGEPKNRWILWILRCGSSDHIAQVASQPYSFRQLISALDAMLEPQAEYEVRWQNEPGETHWRFNKLNNAVSFEAWLDGKGRDMSIHASGPEIIVPFMMALQYLVLPWEPEALNHRIGGEFPYQELERLMEKLRSRKILRPAPAPKAELKHFPKPKQLSEQDVKQFQKSTGWDIAKVKQVLQEASPAYYAKFMAAAELVGNGKGHLLNDPLDSDPQFATILELVEAAAEEELRDEPKIMGYCHRFWSVKKRILFESFGLDWCDPAELNPWAMFD